MKLKDKIKKLKARQVLTSRGLPTVEVEFILENASIISSVPSGKSTGGKEACVVVDNQSSYLGQSVLCVVRKINGNADALLDVDISNPDDFDEFLVSSDGTEDKSNLGANYILPLSICCYKLFSHCLDLKLWKYIQSLAGSKYSIPTPYFNVLNGGVHSGNGISCQEIMVAFQESSFEKNLECAVRLYYSLRDVISEEFGSIFTSVGDEGGFAPPIKSLEEGLDLVLKGAQRASIAGFRMGLDLAANSFYSGGVYVFDGKSFDGKSLADLYIRLVEHYPITSLEDPFAETDADSWRYLYESVGDKITIVADDLTVTNSKMVAGLKGLFNGVLIKPNQVGSVSETIKAIQTAKSLNMKVMVSHRSAETEDTFIMHLAVGMGAEYVKAGAPCRGERVSKYNELLRIEEDINEAALK